MKEFRNELNANERVARKIIGTDTEAKFTVNDETADDIIKREKAEKFNEQVEAMENKLNSHMAAIEEQAEKLSADLGAVDITPMGNYALIKPFEHNPFQKMKVSKSGIYLDSGGVTPEYNSEEDGRMYEEEELIELIKDFFDISCTKDMLDDTDKLNEMIQDVIKKSGQSEDDCGFYVYKYDIA